MSLPSDLATLLSSDQAPRTIFEQVLPAIAHHLQCDRCFLHLRQPQHRLYQNLCWRRTPDLPDPSVLDWQPEETWEQEDPMFAAALRTAPSIFVEDIETAGPDVLNVEFERQYMGHRALVHAHIAENGVLWGILQPAVYGKPRIWSEGDRALILQLVEALKPLVMAYGSSAEGIEGDEWRSL